jgi:hypothetical protein
VHAIHALAPSSIDPKEGKWRLLPSLYVLVDRTFDVTFLFIGLWCKGDLKKVRERRRVRRKGEERKKEREKVWKEVSDCDSDFPQSVSFRETAGGCGGHIWHVEGRLCDVLPWL